MAYIIFEKKKIFFLRRLSIRLFTGYLVGLFCRKRLIKTWLVALKQLAQEAKDISSMHMGGDLVYKLLIVTRMCRSVSFLSCGHMCFLLGKSREYLFKVSYHVDVFFP